MRTDAVLLAQWLSPAFPVGAFAYSAGLEAAVGAGWVAPETLSDWLADALSDGQGRAEAILLRAAAATAAPEDIDALARALCPAAERLTETLALGAAFAAQLRAVWRYEVADLTYPVALGQGVRAAGLDPDLAVEMYLLAFVTNQVQAAQRLMPLGQTEGQRILAGLTPLCRRVAEETRDVPPDDIATQSFAADIAAMRHETQSVRIFRT